MTQFYIEVRGKKHYYNSVEAAVTAANQIFKKTGIVVGVFHS